MGSFTNYDSTAKVEAVIENLGARALDRRERLFFNYVSELVRCIGQGELQGELHEELQDGSMKLSKPRIDPCAEVARRGEPSVIDKKKYSEFVILKSEVAEMLSDDKEVVGRITGCGQFYVERFFSKAQYLECVKEHGQNLGTRAQYNQAHFPGLFPDPDGA